MKRLRLTILMLSTVPFCIATTSSAIAQELLGYWQLEETDVGMDAVDASGNGLDGFYEGAVDPNVAGAPGFGSGADFDGATGQVLVDIGGVAFGNLTNNFSVMAWINPDQFDHKNRIIGGFPVGGGWGFGTVGDSLEITTYGVKDYDQPVPLQLDTWTHVAVVLDTDNAAHFYANGQFVGTQTHSAPGNAIANDFLIGSSCCATEFFDGQLDEVAVFNGTLNEAQVQNAMNLGAINFNGDGSPFPVAGNGTIGISAVSSSVVDGSLMFGPEESGPGFVQEWYAAANPGDKAGVDAIFDSQLPVVSAFRSTGGSWWTGSAGADAIPGVQAYPPEVQPPLTDSYTVRSTGEILIEQSGLFTFLDGVDDFSYLAIDTDKSGTAGDNPDEVLINDNTWTNPIRDANGGGEGWAEVTIDVAEGGEWLAMEFNMAEGGGGDHGMLYWDYDTTAPFGQRLNGIIVPFADQAFFDADEAAAAVVPDTYLRATTAPLISGEVEGSIPGSPNGWQFDVNANDGSADAFELSNPDATIFSSTLDVDGAKFFVNVLEGEVSEGDSFPILLADSFSGTPTVETPGWSYNAATGSVVFGATLVCGDFDMDGDVDSADRTTQTTNWTGALPPGDPNATKVFEEGDCDGDGDIDTADQNGLINNWTGAMNAGNTEEGPDANLIYNPETGEVILDAADTSSGVFISFVLGTAENNMRTENFATSADGSAGPFIDVGTNTDNTPFQIGQTDPLNQGAGPQINLGEILPAGIATKEALAEYLTLAEYASELGQGGTFDLQLVPEPSGLALALLGMVGLLSRRRK